ncbi:MAG: phosphotransferase family protein, partial [Candidatus Eremiobacterota bacterium]
RVPRPVACCQGDSPFYVMERVRGRILRGANGLDPDAMRNLSEELVDRLAELHSLDTTPFADLGRPEGYVERQVRGWAERWRKAATEEDTPAEEVIRWLQDRVPASHRTALIHNDFKYDNLVLDSDHKVAAVLDWEMATLGDPLMDLGTTLGYWVEAGDPPELQALGFGPTFLPGNLTRSELAERYARTTGACLDPLGFYRVFGLFKIAVIGQQIYARYRRGHTSDPRFASLDVAVRLLLQQATSGG